MKRSKGYGYGYGQGDQRVTPVSLIPIPFMIKRCEIDTSLDFSLPSRASLKDGSMSTRVPMIQRVIVRPFFLLSLLSQQES